MPWVMIPWLAISRGMAIRDGDQLAAWVYGALLAVLVLVLVFGWVSSLRLRYWTNRLRKAQAENAVLTAERIVDLEAHRVGGES